MKLILRLSFWNLRILFFVIEIKNISPYLAFSLPRRYEFIADTEFLTYIIAGSDFVPGGELYTLVDECGSLPEDAVRILVAEVALAIGI